jgi:hypothetical protein
MRAGSIGAAMRHRLLERQTVGITSWRAAGVVATYFTRLMN